MTRMPPDPACAGSGSLGSDLPESFQEGAVKRCIGDLTKSSICPNRRVEPDSTLCRHGAAHAPPG